MHILSTGATLSGKSWGLKQLVQILKNDIPVAVCDPMGVAGVNEWPGADLIVHNRGDFLRAFWGSSRSLWIIDEAADVLNGDDDRAVLTKGRHLGHSVIIVAQRANFIRPALRTQCAAVLTGIQDSTDAEELARQFVSPELRNIAPKLDKKVCELAYAETGSRVDVGRVIQPGSHFIRRVADAIRKAHPEPSAAFLEAAQPRPGKPNWEYLISGGHISREDVYK